MTLHISQTTFADESASPAAVRLDSSAPDAEGRGGKPPSPERNGRLARVGGWLFVRRGWIPWLVFPLLLIPTGFEMRFGWKGYALACACLAAGEAMRLWAVGYAGTRTRTRSPDGKLKDLVTAGPYSHVRNPIYVGNCLIGAGIVLVFGQWLLLLPLLLVTFLAYQPVVAWEEQLLAGAFGEEYERFRRAVPRWLPRLQRYAHASSHRFSWATTLFSERGTLGMLVLVLMVAAGKLAWVLADLR